MNTAHAVTSYLDAPITIMAVRDLSTNCLKGGGEWWGDLLYGLVYEM